MSERHVKFWLVGNEEKITGVRGQSEDDRYEFVKREDGTWEALLVVLNLSDDGWGFHPIASGDLFACMVAVEETAKAVEAMNYLAAMPISTD